VIDELGIWRTTCRHALRSHEIEYVRSLGESECEKCGGSGEVKKRAYHNDRIWTNCKSCGGDGKREAGEFLVQAFRPRDLDITVLIGVLDKHSNAWKDTQ
jgi:hypothetical protein